MIILIVKAHRITQGQVPELEATDGSNLFFVKAAEAGEGVRDRIPACFGLDPVRGVQLLCPMNRGGLGARALNPQAICG